MNLPRKFEGDTDDTPTNALVRAAHGFLAHNVGRNTALVAHVKFLIALIEAHAGKEQVGLHDLQMAIAQADPSLRAEFRRMQKQFESMPANVANLVRSEIERIRQAEAQNAVRNTETARIVHPLRPLLPLPTNTPE